MKKLNKTLSGFLAFLMLLQVLPVSVVAETLQDENDATVESVENIQDEDSAINQQVSEIPVNTTEEVETVETGAEQAVMPETTTEANQLRGSPFAAGQNIVTGVKLTKNGTDAYTEQDRPVRGDVVKVELELDWTNQTLDAGTYEYTLPAGIYISGEKSGTLADGVSYVLKTDNTVVITVDATVASSKNVISIDTIFSEFNDADSLEQTLSFPLADGTNQEYNLKFRPSVDKYDSVKTSADKNKELDADILTVTDLVNLDQSLINEDVYFIAQTTFNFKDSASPNGFSDYATRESVEIREVIQSMDGTIIGYGATLVEGVDYTLTTLYSSGSGLKIEFASDHYDALEIKQVIKVKEEIATDENLQLLNHAIFKYDSSQGSSSGASDRGDLYLGHDAAKGVRLAKSGSYEYSSTAKRGLVTWEIHINRSGETLKTGTVFEDVMVDPDIKDYGTAQGVYYIWSSDRTRWLPEDSKSFWDYWDLDEWKNSKRLVYTGEDTTDSFSVKYVVEDTANKDRTLTNTIKEGDNEVSAEVEIKPSSGAKRALKDTIDMNNNTMEWEIDINENYAYLEFYEIEDIYKNHVKSLVEGSLVMVYEKPGEITATNMFEGVDYTIEKTKSGTTETGFKVKLLGDFRNENPYRYLLRFKTVIDFASLTTGSEVENYFEVHGPGNTPITGDAKLSIDKTIMTGGAKSATKGYRDNEDEIYWSVAVNTSKQKNYTELTFYDPIDERLMLVEDSVKFYAYQSIDEAGNIYVGEEIQPGDKRYPTDISTTDNKINLKFANIGNESVVVTYTTKTPYYMRSSVENTAYISDTDGTTDEYSTKPFVELYPESSKVATQDNEDPNLVQWTLETKPRYNIDAEHKSLIIEDVIQATMGEIADTLIIKNSFKVFDETGAEIPSSNYSITFDHTEEIDRQHEWDSEYKNLIQDGNYFRITFHEPVHTVKVTYQTYSKSSTSLTNYAGFSADQDMVYITRKDSVVIKNTSTSGTGSIFGNVPIHKVSNNSGNKSLAGAVFEIFEEDGTPLNYQVTTDENGHAEFENLVAGKYIVKEVTAPEGHVISDELKNGVILETKEADKTAEGYYYTLVNEFDGVSISGTKTWDDNDDQDGKRPNSITVILLGNNVEVARKVVTATDGWLYEFTDLPKEENGQAINYTISEEPVTGYSSSIDGYNITNSHVPETIDIPVTKVWDDAENQDGKRPENITVNLLADGQVVDTQVLTADMATSSDEWAYTFKNQPKYADGTKIVYTVTEDSVSDYSTEIQSHTITNSYTPGQTSVTVTKAWDDNDDQDGLRPASIQVQLLADDEKSGAAITLDAGNNWTYTWDALAEKANGKTIKYTVEEITAVTGYTTKVDDTNQGNIIITNSHTPEAIDIPVTKTWADKNDQDGKRPSTITVNLLADGSPVASQAISKADNWTYTFESQPKYNQGQLIKYTVTEDTVQDYVPTITGFDITNSYTPGQTSVTVTKSWLDNDDQDGLRPTSINVQLLANGTKSGEEVVLNASNNWTYTWTDLDKKTAGVDISYKVQEITEVAGYATSINDSNTGNIIITNSHTPETTSVSGQKTWADNNDQDGKRPATITINLLADGLPTDQVTVSEADGWSYEFTNLPKYANGQLITYTVTEDTVAEYSTKVTGLDVTNSYTPGQTSATVTKVWTDNNDQDGKRPSSINVQLLANGSKSGEEVVLNAGNNWTYTWDNLDEKANGADIEYTVQEISQVAGYATSINDSNKGNMTITNSHTPETTSVSGQKTWADNNDQDGKRPATITINLLADGLPADQVVVSEADDWSYEFTNLPKYANGNLIKYTVTEDAVADYSTKITGFDVTNSYTPGQTSATVTKVWDDNNNQDGIRPASINVQLLANGAKSGEEVVLNAGNNWTYTWDNLDEKANGTDIKYTVQEITKVTGYTSTINDSNKGNMTITNSHTPETISISGTKAWDDAENQDGKRPTTITVNLLADGAPTDQVTVSEADGWSYEFTNLPKYADGNVINYTVTEDAVADYSTKITGFDVTNSYTPGQTSATVTKEWDDNNNQDGIRPQSINVQLLANGVQSGEEVVLNAGNNWTYTWEGLDEKANGTDIEYTVAEISEVTGYETTIDNANQGNLIIINSHTPEVTTIAGEKTWDDVDNQDGKRPTTIQVNLLANGHVVDTATVSETGNWSYAFTNKPKYEDGNLITYTITEDSVTDYTTKIEEFNLTNSYTPAKTSATVTKNWDDNNNQDGIRPESIDVQLLANGKKSGKAIELNAENNWTYTWDGLDEKAKGQNIIYTVEELDAVEGYVTTVDDANHGNMIITNSHTPEETTVSGAKTWDDANNQDGIRPDSITVNLLADGQVVDTLTVSEADEWSYEFANLPKYQAGNEIVYTITEDTVADYTTEIDGFDVTNSYTPGQTSVTVTKSWQDENDQDGIRPDKINVQLYADGEKSGKEITLSAKENWTYTWSELDERNAGTAIAYTVKEVDVPEGYTVTVNDDNQGNVLITNSHTPAAVTSGNNNQVSGGSSNSSTSSTSKANMPKTGEIVSNLLLWVGVALVALVAVLFVRKRMIGRNK